MEAYTSEMMLLAAIGLSVFSKPKSPIQHAQAYMRRRFQNWFPLGLTYAFLYMGRYNLSVAKHSIDLTNAEYGVVGGIGTFVYGCSFLVNGPLTDRLGGRFTILLSTAGVVICNLLMALYLWAGGHSLVGEGLTHPAILAFLYAANMYFQSFGAVSIVKVNTAWFHVRERGTFGGIFGILIALGIFFAYDWNGRLLALTHDPAMVFLVPAIVLSVFFVIDWFWVRDSPEEAGQPSIDTGDIEENGPLLSAFEVGKRMLMNPTIRVVAFVELCSGFLRNAIMQWYPTFATATGQHHSYVATNWGFLLCLAGIFGGMFAGVISDHVFGSRRGPVSAVLYLGLTLGSLGAAWLLGTAAFGWVFVFMSLCVIGVHGMLTAAASMDFAGKKNVGVAVGMIDGFVYAGTAVQFFVLGWVTPDEAHKHDVAAWHMWPLVLIPFALMGFVLSTRIWNARGGRAGQH